MAQPKPNKYRLVALVNSRVEADRSYRVSVHLETGAYSCNCPSWIYQRTRPRRYCKHIKATLDPAFERRSEIAERAVARRKRQPVFDRERPFVQRYGPLEGFLIELWGRSVHSAMLAYHAARLLSPATVEAAARQSRDEFIAEVMASGLLETNVTLRVEGQPKAATSKPKPNVPVVGVRQITLDD